MLRPVPRARGVARVDFPTADVEITSDGAGLAEALSFALSGHGIDARIVRRGVDVSPEARAVIYLSGVRDFASSSDSSEINRDAFAVARTIAPQFAARGGAFIVVQDLGGRFAFDEWCEPSKAPLGGLAGLAKTAALEWPEADVRIIDLDAGHREVSGVAADLVDEILFGTDPEVGMPEGERVVVEMEATASVATRPACIRQGDVVVFSGGARGVTARCALELGTRTGARVVLLGRTELGERPAYTSTDRKDLIAILVAEAKADGTKLTPSELNARVRSIQGQAEIWANLDAFAAAGVEARYHAVDVRDVGDVATVLDAVRREWGPIRGIVHGAGVIRDKLLTEKSEADFEAVFGTKVSGFYSLLAATAGDDLSMICTFSSVAGRTGNVGQSDYAMANQSLDKLSQMEARRRGADVVVKSIAWGPWDAGMVTPELEGMFRERGIALIPLDVGARMFVDEVLDGSADVEVVIGGLLSEDPGRVSASDESKTAFVRTVRVSAQSHPWLADHVIDGQAVLPFAVALDWFTDVSSAALGGRPVSLEEVRVLRAVQLDSLDAETELTVRATPDGAGGVSLELEQGGQVRYRARASALDAWPNRGSLVADEADGPRWSGVIYDGELLFHGPRFQVLDDVSAPTETGLDARVLTANGAEWPQTQFTLDPAAIDGALQLSVLWTNERVPGLALPLKMRRLTRGERLFDRPSVRARLRPGTEGPQKTITDVDLYDEDGRWLASLEGVEVFKYREW